MSAGAPLPQPDEIEVTLLGKGFGESVLVHFGDGQWAVIDSLLGDGSSAPLEYLYEIGVDPAVGLKLIVATHWHADHIGGLAEIVQSAPDAQVVLPGAFSSDNFHEFAKARLTNPKAVKADLSEIAKVGDLLVKSSKSPPVYAQAALPILTRHAGVMSHGEAVSMMCLSPSTKDVDQFHLRLANIPPEKGATKLFAFHENYVSIATWLVVGGDQVLLGADMETVGAPDRGWNAVLSLPHRPPGKASLVKVAHHGSHTGHHDDVWNDMLLGQPFAMIAPWSMNKGLPRDQDKRRILGLTDKGFVTTPTSIRAAQGKDAQLKAALLAHGVTVMGSSKTVGKVRARKKVSDGPGAWTIDLLDGAVPLRKFFARH